MGTEFTKEEIEDIIEWDIETWKNALTIWGEEIETDKEIVCFGEREGGISLWLALQGHRVICTDYFRGTKDRFPLHEKYHIQDLVSYQNEDITNISLPDNSVDYIFFKSILGALSSKEKIHSAVKEFDRILKPGGKIFIAENLRASIFHMTFRKIFTKWAKDWYYPSLKEMKGYFEDNFEEITFKTKGILAVFGRNRVQQKALAKMDKLIPFPEHMKYLGIGVFIKK